MYVVCTRCMQHVHLDIYCSCLICYCLFFSAIGLALADRLLLWDPKIHICLACRSVTRATKAKEELQRQHPTADVSLVTIDVGHLRSVYNAAKELKTRFAL